MSAIHITTAMILMKNKNVIMAPLLLCLFVMLAAPTSFAAEDDHHGELLRRANNRKGDDGNKKDIPAIFAEMEAHDMTIDYEEGNERYLSLLAPHVTKVVSSDIIDGKMTFDDLMAAGRAAVATRSGDRDLQGQALWCPQACSPLPSFGISETSTMEVHLQFNPPFVPSLFCVIFSCPCAGTYSCVNGGCKFCCGTECEEFGVEPYCASIDLTDFPDICCTIYGITPLSPFCGPSQLCGA